MKKSVRIPCCIALASTPSLCASAQTAEKTAPPLNVVVILADDLGWNDISLHGGATPTPNIDRLAAHGVEFRNLLVNSVCSPTRASFYTGRDAVRNGYGGEVGSRMNPAFQTIAQSFRNAGYTTGIFGKWHNGEPESAAPNEPTPMEAGFDTFAGFYGGGTDFYNQTRWGLPRNWFVNDRRIEDGEGYTTDLIHAAAMAFIKQNRTKPFFCMIAHAAVHEPFQATDALLRRVPESIRNGILLDQETVKKRSQAPEKVTDFKTFEYGGFTEAERKVVYSAMTIGLDDAVGGILDELEASGLRNNTAVLFFSDNGAMRFIREGNRPLRAWKHDMYEGAVHVPGFLSWPNGPRESTYEPLIRGVDLYPTLASLAGVPIADAKTLDGTDHFPAITGTASAPEVEWNGIFVYYGAYRNNRWKLIVRAGGCELYDIRNDIAEKNDMAANHPEMVQELLIKHRSWLKETGANVNYTAPQLSAVPAADPQDEFLSVSADTGRWMVDLPVPKRISAEPGDCLAYDMKIEKMVPGQAVYVSPSRGDATIFQGEGGVGINVDGTNLSSTNRPPAESGCWKRYCAGIGNLAAIGYGPFRLMVENHQTETLCVQLDNIHILKADGTVIPIWSKGAAPATKSGLTLTTCTAPNGED